MVCLSSGEVSHLQFGPSLVSTLTLPPFLSAVQTLALLSSHLAGLNFLSGAWNLARLASQDVLHRQLNDPSKCGQGSDAQVRRRAFWLVPA